MKKRIVILVFIILFLGVGSFVYFGQKKEQTEELFYSGTIETTQANLSFQISGRVVGVMKSEGEDVEKDELLVELDNSEFLVRLEQARANLEVAQNNVQQLELALELNQKILPADVERAESGVKALRANLKELQSGYRVQDVDKARLALQSTEAALELARKEKDRYERLFHENISSEMERDSKNLKYETTLKEYESAKKNLDQLKEGFRQETIDTAKAKLAEGEAVLKQAKNSLKKIEVSKKEVETARIRVRVAEAAVKLVETQLTYTQLKSPFKGTITMRNIEPGEVVTPGREVFSIADLSKVDLKIFVGETEIGKVKPGQEVDVKVDTFPGKVFKGKVSFISSEGEFTPKVIQTHKERVKLVYMVKVSIPNSSLELKSGMPADAWLR